ncbi:AAA family ATPase [Allokutzneria sp. A3M-2-11 16]|uniref:BTAD domain-containing putative transcriptional regulator n=1 Tax=Allokutzneria sp. A3M-2-11 16 TaxID=2962043 RepID=UPI0020B8A997|nr:BTAD domain-containing putative transcriptional regulator [Allokutzneria sp. A3M-2-11 16]MCP3800914.1 AAA family ATPase [Allokutzneria sp. A3M-2-11 16]
MDFRMFGPVELWTGGRLVELGPAKQRCVVAALLWTPGQVVPLETLTDRLWGAHPPREARSTIYAHLTRLRGVLRPHFGEHAPIERRSGGYALNVAPEAVDWCRFRSALATARTTTSGRKELLRDALAQWRGTPLAGVPGAWATDVRSGLEQQRIGAAVQWADLELADNAWEPVVGELRHLLDEHPLAEAVAERLIRALVSAGRSAEAVACYAEVRRRIVDELGVEPDSRLRALHQEILAAESVVVVAPPRWRGPQAHLDRLIGRQAELDAVSEALARSRLVTITGAGGSGKTTLALHAAAEISRARWLDVLAVTLAPLRTATQAADALLELLEARAPSDADHWAAVEESIPDCPQLLVLDNCEHLATDLAGPVRRLLAARPRLVVLTTSRQPLGIAGETLFPLAPLAVPKAGEPIDPDNPAIALFVERASQADPELRVDAAFLDVAGEICRRLDGLPLALELAASRVRTFPVIELAARLGTDMDLLLRTTGSDDDRHATLTAAVDWSYRDLDEAEKVLLARLSTFPGGFRPADAEAVCAFPPLCRMEIAGMLGTLVDRSLVQPYQVVRDRRLRLLEMIRVFAHRRLLAFGDAEATGHRHVDHWLAVAARIDALKVYLDRANALRELAPDIENLFRCWEFGHANGRAVDVAEIIARTFELWYALPAHLTRGQRWLDRALRTPDTRPETRALLRFHHALRLGYDGDNQANVVVMSEIVADLRRYRPREHWEARANLITARNLLMDPGVLEEIPPAVAEALESDLEDALIVLSAASSALVAWGHYAEASELCDAYLSRAEVIGRPESPIQQAIRIEALLGQGERETARSLAARLHSELGDVRHAAEHQGPRRALAFAYLAVGEIDRATRLVAETMAWLSTVPRSVATRYAVLEILHADLLRRRGEPEAALAALRSVLDRPDQQDQLRLTAVLVAAMIARDLGDTDAADRLARRWDGLRRERGLPVPLGFTDQLDGLDLTRPLPAPADVRAGVAEAAEYCAQGSRKDSAH